MENNKAGEHTQGKWISWERKIEGRIQHQIFIPDKEGIGEHIAWVDKKANARLIASAPKMLEALEDTEVILIRLKNKGLLSVYEEKHWLPKVESAIKAAKGE